MKLLEVNLHRLLMQREQWIKNNTGIAIADQSLVVQETPDLNRIDENGSKVLEEENYDTEGQRKMTEKLKVIIEENINDPNLSPDQLASELGVSRTKLYRDLKRIDGYSLSDYVRHVRLEKAAYLLANSTLNIQEIMNEVGFINSSHFTKIFKLKYGMTPTEYKRKVLKS